MDEHHKAYPNLAVGGIVALSFAPSPLAPLGPVTARGAQAEEFEGVFDLGESAGLRHRVNPGLHLRGLKLLRESALPTHQVMVVVGRDARAVECLPIGGAQRIHPQLD